MKDFYDIWIVNRSFSFDDDRLPQAIAATFARRGTDIPTEQLGARSPTFAADEQKQRQWQVFLESVTLDPGTLAEVTGDLSAFLLLHAARAAQLGR